MGGGAAPAASNLNYFSAHRQPEPSIKFGFSDSNSAQFEGGSSQKPLYYRRNEPYVFPENRVKEVNLTFQFWLRFFVVAAVIIVCLIVSYNSIDLKGESVHGVRDVILSDTK